MANTIAEYQAAQAAEWGAYVASSVIYIDGVRAFNEGDAVPASHVDNGVVNPAQVRKANAPSKKGEN